MWFADQYTYKQYWGHEYCDSCIVKIADKFSKNKRDIFDENKSFGQDAIKSNNY